MARKRCLPHCQQPYGRGEDFRNDPLWALHELSRVDKHQIDLDVTGSCPQTSIGSIYFEAVEESGLGYAGPVQDGTELAYWVIPSGYKEPDAELDFTRGVAFGQTTLLRNQPVIPTLRGIRNYLRFKVVFPLAKFL